MGHILCFTQSGCVLSCDERDFMFSLHKSIKTSYLDLDYII